MQTLLKDYRILYQRNQAIVGTAICTISQIMPTTAASGYFLREAENTMARFFKSKLTCESQLMRGEGLLCTRLLQLFAHSKPHETEHTAYVQ
jgi:hypothetical protein